MIKPHTFLTKKDSTKEIQTLSKHKQGVLQDRAEAKSLLRQYERIVKEQRKLIHDLTNNLGKMIYTYMYNKLHKKGGR